MLEVPLLDLKYSDAPTVLCVPIAPAEMLLYLNVIDSWIDVPVSVESITPHGDTITPDKHTRSYWRNHTNPI